MPAHRNTSTHISATEATIISLADCFLRAWACASVAKNMVKLAIDRNQIGTITYWAHRASMGPRRTWAQPAVLQ